MSFRRPTAPVDYAATQTFRRKGDLLIAELKRERGEPKEFAGVLALGDGRGLEFTATPGDVPEGGTLVGGLGAQAILFGGARSDCRRLPAQPDAMRVPDPGVEGAALARAAVTRRSAP